ncbi:MAG: L,D-transpeptidase family protein [Thermomicrobiales bacterium]|nr:L,D-transpeptidase family protein [Thermomicrobiales bacterium]
MKRFATFLIMLSLLAAVALPVVEPTYSAFAQPEGSVVSDPDGGDSAEQPPADEPVATETPVPPLPSETPVPPSETPIPPSTDTPEPPATLEPSATDVPVEPAVATSTPVKDFQTGDLVATTLRLNCRDIASTSGSSVLTILEQNQQVFVVEPAQEADGFNWIKVQLQDDATTRCFAVDQYLKLIQANVGVPPTASPTGIPTETLTPSVTNTPTETLTPSVTSTPSNTPIATPYKNLKTGDVVVANTRINCRDLPTTSGSTVLIVIAAGQQVYIVESAQASDGYDWVKVQLSDAATTQCYLAAQFVGLLSSGVGVPPTITPTPTNTPTLTPSATPTVTETPTITLTPTETLTPTITLTPTETLTPTVTLTPTETLTPTVTSTPSNTPVATITSTPTYRDLHVGDIGKANQSLNCRVSNSTAADILLVLDPNNHVVILTDPVYANGYYWSKVRVMGTTKECYATAMFIDLVQSGGGFTPTPATSVTATVEAAGPYKVGDIIETTNSVNVRLGGGTNFGIVGTVNAKTKGTVLSGFAQSGAYDWVKVQFPTMSGWVAVNYTKLVSSSTVITNGPYAAGTQLVVVSAVNLRVLPGTSSTSLGQLQAGQQGLALGASTKIGTTTWIQAEFAQGNGWVASEYIKKLSAVTPTTGPSVGKIWVNLDCTSNPEKIIVQNNNPGSIRIISIGSTYNPSGSEPYSVNYWLSSKVTVVYQANSNASGNFRLTGNEMFTDSVGSQDGAIVRTSAGTVTAKCPAVTTGEKWIEVNLSTQTMYVYRGSTIVSSSLVSTGKPGFDTPTGTFRIYAKYPLVRMTACVKGECYDTPNVPWDMLFREGGFYIHGVYWHKDFGRVRSHGCVNLPTPYAEWLYGWTPLGTRVWIHY